MLLGGIKVDYNICDFENFQNFQQVLTYPRPEQLMVLTVNNQKFTYQNFMDFYP